MSGGLVCTVCGMHSIARSGAEFEWHRRIRCGTWQHLLAGLQHEHNTCPERMEQAVRSLLRCEGGQCECEGGPVPCPGQ